MKNFELIIWLFILSVGSLFSQSSFYINRTNTPFSVGLKVHVPYLLQNNLIFEVSSYDTSNNNTYVNSIETGAEFFGIYLTLGFDITNNITIEALGGIKGNKFPYASSGITNSFGSSLKYYFNNQKSFYGLATLLVEKFMPSLPLDKPGISNSKLIDDGFKKFIGLGAGILIWNNLFIEISYMFAMGGKYTYEVTYYFLSPEIRKVTSIGSLNINLNYHWNI